MIGLVTRNFGWKFLSLMAAVALWMSVGSEPELSTFLNVPVVYRDAPDDMEIGSSVVEAVDLEVRGPSGEVRGLGDSKPAVVLDMSGVQGPSQRTFTISAQDVKLPRGVRLVRAIPAQIRFSFERRGRVSVPVQARSTGSPPKGYEIAGYEVSPGQLTIIGPESHVRRVTQVQTDAIDVSSVYSVQEFHPSAYVNDPQVRFETPPSLTVRVTIRKKP